MQREPAAFTESRLGGDGEWVLLGCRRGTEKQATVLPSPPWGKGKTRSKNNSAKVNRIRAKRVRKRQIVMQGGEKQMGSEAIIFRMAPVWEAKASWE